MSQPDEKSQPQINTESGAYVEGNVSNSGGSNVFVGTTCNITYTDIKRIAFGLTLEKTSVDASDDGTRFLAQLQNPDWHVREHAAGILGRRQRGDAVEPLLQALHDDHKAVRHAVICALGKLHDPQAIPALSVFLQNEPKAYIRGATATSLGWIGDPRACAPLVAALTGNTRAVRLCIVRALGRLMPSAEDVLVPLLTSENSTTRYLAVWALGRIGTARSLPRLETIQKLDNAQVAWYGQKKQPIVRGVKDVADAAIVQINTRVATNAH